MKLRLDGIAVRSRTSVLARRLAGIGVFAATGFVSYVSVSAVRSEFDSVPSYGNTPPPVSDSTAAPVNPFNSGTHLIAYVVASSDCGWSTLPQTMDAVGRLRGVLREAHGERYAEVKKALFTEGMAPASTTIIVKGLLIEGLMMEIEAIATVTA